MPKNKSAPYIFLALLIVVLAFIIGLRYGQQVEKTNKVINYLISLPPTKAPVTPIPLIYQSFENKNCGIRFLYPNSLIIKNGATAEAKLFDQDKAVLELNCLAKNELLTSLHNPKLATVEVSFKNRKIIGKSQIESGKKLLIFSTTNSQNGKTLYFAIADSLYPLFEKTLEFFNK